MNAPIRTLSAMPAAIQREHDEALWQTWENGDARRLLALQMWPIRTSEKILPDSLAYCPEYEPPVWRATTHIDSTEIEGEGATALGALADMMRLAEKHVQNEDEMRREGV